MKVLISSRSFGEIEPNAINIIKKSKLQPVLNPLGRKLNEKEIIDLMDSSIVGIIAGTEKITKKVIEAGDNLKVISRFGIGLDNVDLDSAKRHNILVYNTPETPTIAVAELSLGLILNLLRKIGKNDAKLKNEIWDSEIGNLLTDKTVGIIGLGRIGKQLVKFLKPFQCKINVYDLKPDQDFVSNHNLTLMPLTKLLSKSDILSIHVPLTAETKNLISKNELKKMKNSAIIINTARGELIDENDLYDSLKKQDISGAAIDVFKNEPYKGKLIELDNIILTPHIGSLTFETRKKMEIKTSKNLIKGLKNRGII